MDNIENVAKEAMLTFFVESVEPYLVKFNLDTNTLNKINRWVCKITRLNVYSMKTHLLLLQQMIKKGELSPPFSNDPETTTLPQFEPASPQTSPNLDRILQLFNKPKTSQSGGENAQVQDNTIRYAESSESTDGNEGSNPSSRIPRRNANSRHFTIPERRSQQNRSVRLHRSLLDKTYDLERPPNDRTYCVQTPLLERTYDIDRIHPSQPICIPERITHPRPRSVPRIQQPHCVQRTDRCVQSVCQERITNYDSPTISTPCRGSVQLPDFSISPILRQRTRSLPRRLSETYNEENILPRTAPKSRIPIGTWRIGPTTQAPTRPLSRNGIPECSVGQCRNRSTIQAPMQYRLDPGRNFDRGNDQGSATTNPTNCSLPCPRLRPRRLSFEDESRINLSLDDPPRPQSSGSRIPSGQWSRPSVRVPRGSQNEVSNSSGLGNGSGPVNECCP